MVHRPERDGATRYQLCRICPPENGQAALAVFHVTDRGGQSRDEILRFAVIEARALLWEDSCLHKPEQTRKDLWGFHNYRQYVKALVTALQYEWI